MGEINSRDIHGTTVYGSDLDRQTRCAHWHSQLDVIAIRFKCCGRFYACAACHQELADHAVEVWPKDEWDVLAILCGACGGLLAIGEYMAAASKCPRCGAHFNLGCAGHYHLYFAQELPSTASNRNSSTST